MSHEIDWNVGDYKPQSGDFEVLPAGDYVVKVVKHEWKPIKGDAKANGEGLNLHLEVIEGEQKGSRLFEWLNVKSTAPKAEGKKLSSAEMARGKFRAIVDSCGLASCKNVAELYGIPFVVVVACKADDRDKTKMRNELRSYKKRVRDALPKAAGGGAAAGSEAAPWSKSMSA